MSMTDTTAPTQPTEPQSNGGFLGFVSRIPGDIAKGVSNIPVVGKAASTVMGWAAKPLQEIQKDYRFVHSLYADHGPVAGIVGTLGVLAGAGIGLVTTGTPTGLAFGAEAGAAATRNILGRVTPAFKDSFDKSNDPNYLVSFGRDLAHGLSKFPGLGTFGNTGAGMGQIVSGIADAAFDFEGDPLATLGKAKAQVRNGDMLAVARDDAGNLMRDSAGKPIVRATLPFASSRPGFENFFLANSNVVHSGDQLDAILADRVNGASLRRGLQDVADTNNLAEMVTKYGARYGWSQAFSKALVNAKSVPEVVQVFKQGMYSAELADDAKAPIAELRLPTKTVGRLLSEKIGPDRILASKYATTVNEQKNFILPRASKLMDPVLDENGKPVLDANGVPIMETRVDANGEAMMKINMPVLLSPSKEAFMNALAGKVRTFTTRRPLSYDTKNDTLSAKEIDFADPNVGETLTNIGLIAMPKRIALERASDILAVTDEEQRLARVRALWKEVAKNYGVADKQAKDIFGQVDDAVTGNPIANSAYLVNKGQIGGDIDKIDGTTGKMAVVADQRYKGKLYDIKDLRKAVRESNAYGTFYNNADDFFTAFTNRVFAPLTLLSGGFGLRVSGGEALHQVMRRGLPSYLNNLLANSLKKFKDDYARRGHLDAIADGLNETDLDAIEKEQATGKEQVITENEITKELVAKEKNMKAAFEAANQKLASKQSWNDAVNAGIQARYKVMPFGWAANKFLKSNLVPYTVRQKIQELDRFHRVMGTSEGLTTGIAAGHEQAADLDAEQKFDIFVKTHGHGSVAKTELSGLTQDDPTYYNSWAKNISMARNDMAQRDIANDYMRLDKTAAWKNLSEDEKFAQLVDLQTARLKDPNTYPAYRKTMDGYKHAVPESFAKAQVDYLQGIVHGQGNIVNKDIIQSIAQNRELVAKDLKSIPDAQLPVKVLGYKVQPTLSNALRRVEDIGYRKFVNPIINWVSRHPLFTDFYTRRAITNQTLVDMGLLSEDEMVRLSATQATREMIPAIHSPAIRSQFAVLHRNLFPFYFAQEQAMRRVGRLIMSNPQAFRDFQIVQQGLNNPGFVHTDASGKKYIVYPGLGEFGNAVARGLNALGMQQYTGLPESITGNTSSLLTVLPEFKMPSVGPFVNLGLTQLANRFPWLNQATNVATGGYPSQNFIDTLLPNSAMRDIFNAMNMDDRESMVYNSKLSAIAAAYYHGDLPDNFASLSPFQQSAILNKIDNNARSNLIIKGILSFFLPLAPGVSNDYYDKNLQTLRSEYLNLLRTTNPATGQNYTLPEALNKFIADQGPKAVSYTVARSESKTGAATIPLIDSAMQWINNNGKILNDPTYSNAAPYLIPYSNASSPDALKLETDLVAKGLRAKKTPTEFLNSLYVQKGWTDLALEYKDYQNFMTEARKQNNRTAEYQISQAWKNVAATYGQSNPIWFADYSNPSNLLHAQNAVEEFQKMANKGLLVKSPIGDKIQNLLNEYDVYHQALTAATLPNGRHAPMYGNIQDAWYALMDQMIAQDPSITTVVNGVFRRVK